MNKNIKLKPWPELQKELPELSSWEKERLKESIETVGVLDPILCLPDGRIIDGHHRWKYSKEDPPKNPVKLDEETAFSIGLRLNAERRNLSPEQQKELWNKIKERALKLRSQGLTQEKVAKQLGISRNTLASWESNVADNNIFVPDLRISVPKKEKENLYKRYESGETQAEIASDYKITRQRAGQIIRQVKATKEEPEPTETPEFPNKKYRCIVIDPPWPMEKIEREVAPDQGKKLDYPTMALEKIAELPIPDLINPNGCHVYLWTTHKYLSKALELFEKWEIRYECLLTWVKPTGFTPFSWMYNTEHILFGRGGDGLDLEKKGIKLSFAESVKRHSAKPDTFYDIVRRASPEPRLELFARQERGGFEVWGNEVEARNNGGE